MPSVERGTQQPGPLPPATHRAALLLPFISPSASVLVLYAVLSKILFGGKRVKC